MAIGRKWAGHIYGTNLGEFFLEFDDSSTDEKLTGTLRLMDRQFGLTIFEVVGTYKDALTLAGKPTQKPEGIDAGDIAIVGGLSDDASLKGTWRSSLGTAGTFTAYPHDQKFAVAKQEPALEQLFTSRIELGALRLYSDGITDLARSVTKDFTSGRAVVTYIARGNEISRYFDDFEKEAASLAPLRRFKLHIQEPEGNGLNKVVTVDLNAFGENHLMVQGSNESWVTGKAEALSRTLREHQSALVTTYKKFGMTLNQTIFMSMLVVIPAIETLWQRALFVLAVVLLLQVLYWLHSKFIPVLVLYPATKRASAIAKIAPTVLSWLGAVSSALVAAWLFYVLTGTPAPK